MDFFDLFRLKQKAEADNPRTVFYIIFYNIFLQYFTIFYNIFTVLQYLQNELHFTLQMGRVGIQ